MKEPSPLIKPFQGKKKVRPSVGVPCLALRCARPFLTFYSRRVSWKLTSLESAAQMFKDAKGFNQDLGTWDTPRLLEAGSMFQGATSFNGNGSEWDVSRLKSARSMFQGAESFNQDMSSWDVSSVTDFGSMFADATSFNQDFSEWDISAGTTFAGMFQGATSFNQSLCSWGQSMSPASDVTGMFSDTACTDTNLLDLSGNPRGPLCESCVSG